MPKDAKLYVLLNERKIYKLFEKAGAISNMVVGLANIKHVDRDKVVEILEKN